MTRTRDPYEAGVCFFDCRSARGVRRSPRSRRKGTPDLPGVSSSVTSLETQGLAGRVRPVLFCRELSASPRRRAYRPARRAPFRAAAERAGACPALPENPSPPFPSPASPRRGSGAGLPPRFCARAPSAPASGCDPAGTQAPESSPRQTGRRSPRLCVPLSPGSRASPAFPAFSLRFFPFTRARGG